MKTKREVLKSFAKTGNCPSRLYCIDCPYSSLCSKLDVTLRKIGARKLLKMFPEKKKPLLSVGTKIKFSNGEIATVVVLRKECCLMFENHIEKFYYLVGRSWEVEE